jgi:uncharacterized damage-inducible protein DinB
MKRLGMISCVVIGLSGCAAPAPPPPPPAPPSTAVTASLKSQHEATKGYITKSIEQIAENRFGFQPTKEVRTIGQLFGHIADGNYLFCSAVSSEAKPGTSIEKSVTSKADLQKALAESFAYCDRVWAATNDQTGASEATLPELGNLKTTRLGALSFNTAHNSEHYGNLVTYMRMNKMVPPSSQNTGM